MTQIVLNIEDKSLLPGLRKILSNLNGVTIAKTKTASRKGTLSRAVEEVRQGEIGRMMYEILFSNQFKRPTRNV